MKKLGRIPDGGGWRAHGREATVTHKHKKHLIGFDYVHAVIDGHSRLAYAEIHDGEKRSSAAGVLLRAAAFFARNGVAGIEAVMPIDELQVSVDELAASFAGVAPLSMRIAKTIICDAEHLELAEAHRHESLLNTIIRTSADRKEGIAAFREKCKPRFVGD